LARPLHTRNKTSANIQSGSRVPPGLISSIILLNGDPSNLTQTFPCWKTNSTHTSGERFQPVTMSSEQHLSIHTPLNRTIEVASRQRNYLKTSRPSIYNSVYLKYTCGGGPCDLVTSTMQSGVRIAFNSRQQNLQDVRTSGCSRCKTIKR
jgi:hypothetical protein